jgi:tetrahydromethanopterin S-methyltransferase subunit B
MKTTELVILENMTDQLELGVDMLAERLRELETLAVDMLLELADVSVD